MTEEIKRNVFDTCILMRLSMKSWAPRLVARQASAEVANQYEAEQGTARVIKTLLPKRLENKIQATRNFIHRNFIAHTLAYEDGAYRLGTDQSYDHFLTKWHEYQQKWDDLVQEIVREYPAVKADAPNRLGKLYDASEWPADIKPFFALSIEVYPLPRAENLTTIFGRERYEYLKADMERAMSEKFQEAMKENWDRLRETVVWFHNALSDTKMDDEGYEAKKESIKIREDILQRMADRIDLYESLNFNDDERIKEIIALCRDELFKYNVGMLRQSEEVRNYTSLRAKDIADAMDSVWA